jgi:hypothetical protein
MEMNFTRNIHMRRDNETIESSCFKVEPLRDLLVNSSHSETRPLLSHGYAFMRR